MTDKNKKVFETDVGKEFAVFRRVGVVFTEEQKKIIEFLTETYKTIEVQQIVSIDFNEEFKDSGK